MLDFNFPTLISAIVTLLIAFTFHEFAHAWTAKMFGDDTAERAGRLTLNPLSHLDPYGSLMLILVGFGWAKPVPVNMYELRRNSRIAPLLVSLSGTLTNLILAGLAAIPLRLNLFPYQTVSSNILPTPYFFLYFFLITNLGLMVFNLLPVPPLDGHEIITFLLPSDLTSAWERFSYQYGMLVLIALLILGPMIGFDIKQMVLWPVVDFFTRLLLNVS